MPISILAYILWYSVSFGYVVSLCQCCKFCLGMTLCFLLVTGVIVHNLKYDCQSTYTWGLTLLHKLCVS